MFVNPRPCTNLHAIKGNTYTTSTMQAQNGCIGALHHVSYVNTITIIPYNNSTNHYHSQPQIQQDRYQYTYIEEPVCGAVFLPWSHSLWK